MRSGGRAIRAACGAVAVAVAASGCALVSASGTVHQVDISRNGSGQNLGYPQLLPSGPRKGWTPGQIVTGFLEANASFANHFAIARKFLTKSEARSWQPDGAVTVVSDLHSGPPNFVPKRQPNEQSEKETSVFVTGSQLASLTGSGQYLTAPGTKQSYTFQLIRVGSEWRISQMLVPVRRGDQVTQQGVSQRLMLTKDELERVYQQRNLYFLDPYGEVLVPDPVFVPQNDTSSDLATRLVRGLLNNPQGWLAGAARTAFPRGTKLAGPVSINGPNATVSLTVPGRAVTSVSEEDLAAQLVWTLTSTSYGPTPIQIVVIQVNGRTLTLNGGPFQRPKGYQEWVPAHPPDAGPYFISRSGTVRRISASGLAGSQPGSARFSAAPVSGQAGAGGVPSLSAIAIQPGERGQGEGLLAGLSADGKVIYTGALSRDAPLAQHRLGGGTYNSLSWDGHGDLWVAGNNSLWLLTPGVTETAGYNTQEIPLGNLDLSPGSRLAAFRVAPDGVRAAMIIKNRGGQSRVLLGAVTLSRSAGLVVGTIGPTQPIAVQIPAPQDLTWYDADHVIVLTRAGGKPQLEEIPLNGGQPVPVSTETGTTSVTAGGGMLAAGLSSGALAMTPGLNAPWQQVGLLGRAPAYPG
ncbi:MAG TPA: LpqB family beta-propeller domain-containing protein [Streptosporangiaceae bacterium]|jgi:hypothetical protein